MVRGYYASGIFILCTVFSAIFQSSTIGFAGIFPSKYTSMVMSGQVKGILTMISYSKCSKCRDSQGYLLQSHL